jgi:hypothetical protein
MNNEAVLKVKKDFWDSLIIKIQWRYLKDLFI